MADIRIYPYRSPRIIEVLDPDIEIDIQELHNLIRDWEDGEEGHTFDYLIDSAGKEPLGGGVYVGITSTLQDAYVMFTGRTTPIETGICSSDDSDGTTLYAAYGQFVTNGVAVGDTVMNYTTKALANVINVVSDVELEMLQLSGGSRSTWLSSDEYIIWNNEQCNISGGNLVAVDSGGSEMSSVLPSPNVQVVRTASSSATLQEIAAIEYSSFDGGVHLDAVNGVPGTVYPTGTERQKSDNLADALLIAQSRGLVKIFVYGNFTVGPTDNIDGYTIVGQGFNATNITVTSGASTDSISVERCKISGALNGEMMAFRECNIGNISGFSLSGAIDCILEGTITLSGAGICQFVRCVDGLPGVGIPTIDFGAGCTVGVWGYHGGLKMINKTGSEPVSANLDTGRLVLDSTVSAGAFIVRGVGEIEDNSIGTATVNSVGLVSNDRIADTVWDESRVDHTGAGTYGATDEWAGEVDEESIADAVWDEARSGHTDVGTFGAVDEWAGEVDEDAIADAVWDEALADHLTPGTTGKKLNDGGTGDPSTIAAAVWDALQSDYGTPGTMGWLQGLMESGLIAKPRIIPGD
jgi:hypothetical protein